MVPSPRPDATRAAPAGWSPAEASAPAHPLSGRRSMLVFSLAHPVLGVPGSVAGTADSYATDMPTEQLTETAERAGSGRVCFGRDTEDYVPVVREHDGLVRRLPGDGLTLLPDRRALYAEMDRRAAAGEGYALALLDLDRFKAINDALGHAAGGWVLFQVAARLREVASETGWFAA